VTRIDLVYGGKPYSLGANSVESFQTELSQAILAGTPYWLKVNAGEGRIEDAYLLIAPGIPLAIINVTPDGPRSESAEQHHVENLDTFALDAL
jgi:hypothetical protein